MWNLEGLVRIVEVRVLFLPGDLDGREKTADYQ